MKALRVGLHSFVLVAADIMGIGGGAVAAFRILGVPNQVWLQLPIAVVLTIGSFWGWAFFLRRWKQKHLQPTGARELGACFAASLLWGPFVFVPLHYVTQGYLTSIGNLVGLAIFQLPVNVLSVYGAAAFMRFGVAENAPNR